MRNKTTAAGKDLASRYHLKFLKPTPLPFAGDLPRLYHYTGAVALERILLERCLWATNFSFLNDPSEVDYGSDLVREALKEIERDDRTGILKQINSVFDPYKSDVYVSCFTELPDDLSQWRAYGTPKAPRYCIRFDFYALQDRAMDFWAPAEKFPVNLCKVIYKKEEQREKILGILKKTVELVTEISQPKSEEIAEIAELAAIDLTRLLPRLKSPAYAAEKEWRVIRWITSDNVSELSFDTSRGVVRPYVLFPIQEPPANQEPPSNQEPPPIVELIVLAPGREIASEKAAKMLLLKAGIKDVQPKRSAVPFAE